MGGRLLRKWVEQPLLNAAEITRRHAAVGELKEESLAQKELAELFKGVFDLERLMCRVVYGTANGRDLRALAATLSRCPGSRPLFPA
jgi:DNA mismatch repair protein MutS